MRTHLNSAICVQRRVEREFPGVRVTAKAVRLKGNAMRIRVHIRNVAGIVKTTYEIPFREETHAR